jgi:hypothetical protein
MKLNLGLLGQQLLCMPFERVAVLGKRNKEKKKSKHLGADNLLQIIHQLV